MRLNMNSVESYWSLAHDLPDTWLTNLLELGYSVDQPDESGEYMLGLACECLQLENVRLALSLGADPNCREMDGFTGLDCATTFDNSAEFVAHVRSLYNA